MVELANYVPVLPTRRGELRALAASAAALKARISPLFVITTAEVNAVTPPEQVIDGLANNIADTWGTDPAFADGQALGDASVAPGVHPVARFHEAARGRGLALIPVTGLVTSLVHRRAVRDTAELDGRGFCLRVPVSQWRELRGHSVVYRLLTELRTSPDHIDLILDLAGHAGSGRAFSDMAATVAELPLSSMWRSLVVVGTSYPSPREHLHDGVNVLPRSEWLRYEELIMSGAVERAPAFGDYGITHPAALVPSPYLTEIRGTLRYTTAKEWLIVRGELYRTLRKGEGLGADAIPPIARELMAHPLFGLSQHCPMESWVASVSHVNSGGGNPELWHMHATSHHLAVVSEEFDRLWAVQSTTGRGGWTSGISRQRDT